MSECPGVRGRSGSLTQRSLHRVLPRGFDYKALLFRPRLWRRPPCASLSFASAGSLHVHALRGLRSRLPGYILTTTCYRVHITAPLTRISPWWQIVAVVPKRPELTVKPLSDISAAFRTTLTALRAKEADLAADLEQVRTLIAGLQQRFGDASPQPRRTPKREKPAGKASVTVPAATVGVMRGATTPLRPAEIADRLLGLPEFRGRNKKTLRKAVSAAISRRSDLFRPMPGGRYFAAAENGNGRHVGAISPVETATPLDENTSPKPSTIFEAMKEALTAAPGLSSTEIANRVVARIQVNSAEPRKVVLTRLSQFVGKGRIRREAGRHYVD